RWRRASTSRRQRTRARRRRASSRGSSRRWTPRSCWRGAPTRRSGGPCATPASTSSASPAPCFSWAMRPAGSAPLASPTATELRRPRETVTRDEPVGGRDRVPRRHRVLARPVARRLRPVLPAALDVGRGPAPLVCALLRLRRDQLHVLRLALSAERPPVG